MKFPTLNRKVHYWVSIFVAAPVLIIISTGLLLQMKKQLPWVQPPEQRGEGRDMEITFPQILAICRNVPEAQVQSWEDINRLDVRPSRGMIKVWTKNNWEVQIDSGAGKVLQVAYRRSDLIEAIHDGSWFHESAKLTIFLPAGVTLLLLWLTGIYLFFLPIFARRRQRAKLAKQSPPFDLGPAGDQVFLILFGTGMRYRTTASASIGGTDSAVLYVGPSVFVGLDQCNVNLPRSLAGRGEVNVVMTVDGRAVNRVRASFR